MNKNIEKNIYRMSWTRPDGGKGSVVFESPDCYGREVLDKGLINYLISKGCTDIKTELAR